MCFVQQDIGELLTGISLRNGHPGIESPSRLKRMPADFFSCIDECVTAALVKSNELCNFRVALRRLQGNDAGILDCRIDADEKVVLDEVQSFNHLLIAGSKGQTPTGHVKRL